MKPLTKLHVSLLALALLNMLPVIQVEESWGIWSIAVASALLSCIVSKPEGGTRVSPTILYSMVGVASINLLYEMFGPHEEQTVYIIDLAHFMIFLCCCKFFELRTNRDAALVVIISGLLVLIAAFASASPIFGVVVVIDISFGVAWLFSFQSLRDTDFVFTRRQMAWNAAGAGSPPRQAEWSRCSAASYLGATAWCFAGLVVIGSLCFIAIPRGWGRGLFGKIQGVMPASVTGFTDQIQLGDSALFQDETPVMRVHLRSPARGFKQEDYPLYLRGTTFERYDQGSWHPLRKSPRVVELASDGSMTELSVLADSVSPDRVIEQDILLERMTSGSLFSAYPPLTIASDDVKIVKIDQSDLGLHSEERPHGPVHYVVRSIERMRPGDLPWLDVPPPRRSKPSSLSLIPPEVRKFAREFFAAYGDPSDPAQRERLARRLCEHLQSGAYEYTLARGRTTHGDDPVKDFLFQNKRGHCEYFASAMAVLCQAVDMPVRLVNGYFGGEYNPVGGYIQIKQSDAHAWVEVFVPERGWVLFDPTPPTPIQRSREDDGFLAHSRKLADYLQYRWTSLVSFDAESRYDLVGRITSWLRRLDESGDQKPVTLSATILAFLWGPEVLPLWQRFFYWLLLALCLTFLILIMRVLAILSLMIKERFPIGRRRVGHGSVRNPEARFYDRLLLLLANKGHVKPAHISPREFASDLARSYRDLATLPRLTEWFYEAQYGHRSIAKKRRVEIGEFLQRLREDPPFGTR